MGQNREIKFRAYTKLGMIEDVIYFDGPDSPQEGEQQGVPEFMIHIDRFEEQAKPPELLK